MKALRHFLPAAVLAFPVLALAHDHPPPAAGSLTAEKRYLAENDAAMTKMMAGMTIRPSGDVDKDFVDMMVPHHQGAIDMAVAVLRHGKNEKIRRMAQEIIVDQQQEIAAMRLAVGETLPPQGPSPTEAKMQDRSQPMRMK